MAIQRQLRRGTKAENDGFTGAIGELVQDTDNDRIIVHDGSKQGGYPVPNYLDAQSQYFTAADAVGTDTLTLTLPYAPTAYAEYQRFTFKSSNNNTGATTLNVNSLGAKNIYKDDGDGTLVDLEADDIKANIPYDVIYDGTHFVLQLGGAGGGAVVLLAETIISSPVAQVDYNSSILTGFRRYRFEFEDVIPSSSGASFIFRYSSNNGSSYVSGSNYYNFSGAAAGSASTFGAISNVTLRGSAGDGCSGEMTILNALGSSYKAFDVNTKSLNSATGFFAAYIGTTYADSASQSITINAIRFLMSSGNIASGRIKVYGIN